MSKAYPPVKTRHDGQQGFLFQGFRACVVIQLEGIEVVRHVADPQVLSIARFYPSENDSANPNLIGRQLESGSCSPHDLCQLRLLPRKGLSHRGLMKKPFPSGQTD